MVVTPAKAGVQNYWIFLDSRFHGNDRKGRCLTSYETIKSFDSINFCQVERLDWEKTIVPKCLYLGNQPSYQHPLQRSRGSPFFLFYLGFIAHWPEAIDI